MQLLWRKDVYVLEELNVSQVGETDICGKTQDSGGRLVGLKSQLHQL